MSVYSGSDYTESNCYDQKQVEADTNIEISSNASGQQHHCNHLHPHKDPPHEIDYNANNRRLSTSLSGTGTGSLMSVRRCGWSKLYWEPQCFKATLYLMFFPYELLYLSWQVLGPKGFCGVQVSPPMEHIQVEPWFSLKRNSQNWFSLQGNSHNWLALQRNSHNWLFLQRNSHNWFLLCLCLTGRSVVDTVPAGFL